MHGLRNIEIAYGATDRFASARFGVDRQPAASFWLQISKLELPLGPEGKPSPDERNRFYLNYRLQTPGGDVFEGEMMRVLSDTRPATTLMVELFALPIFATDLVQPLLAQLEMAASQATSARTR